MKICTVVWMTGHITRIKAKRDIVLRDIVRVGRGIQNCLAKKSLPNKGIIYEITI